MTKVTACLLHQHALPGTGSQTFERIIRSGVKQTEGGVPALHAITAKGDVACTACGASCDVREMTSLFYMGRLHTAYNLRTLKNPVMSRLLTGE